MYDYWKVYFPHSWCYSSWCGDGMVVSNYMSAYFPRNYVEGVSEIKCYNITFTNKICITFSVELNLYSCHKYVRVHLNISFSIRDQLIQNLVVVWDETQKLRRIKFHTNSCGAKWRKMILCKSITIPYEEPVVIKT